MCQCFSGKVEDMNDDDMRIPLLLFGDLYLLNDYFWSWKDASHRKLLSGMDDFVVECMSRYRKQEVFLYI